MIFHKPQKKIEIPMLHIAGGNIDCVNNFNFLAIVLNHHLNWHSHTTVDPLIYDPPLMSDHPPFTTTFHVTDGKHTVCPRSSTITPLTRPATGSFELLPLTNDCEMNVRYNRG